LLPKFEEDVSEPDLVDITPTFSGSSHSKMVSPTKYDCDMNLPLKRLKRRIKIEKMHQGFV